MAARSIALFAVAALCEIGGAWLIWQAVREGGAWWWGVAGGASLVAYGFVAALQTDPNFGRVLAATGVCSWRAPCSGPSFSMASGPTATTSSGRRSAWSGSA